MYGAANTAGSPKRRKGGMHQMNNVTLIGRLTKDPVVTYTQSDQPKAIARFTLAVDRRVRTDEGQKADFIPCVTFGKTAEFIEKYFRKGMKMGVRGRILTGGYTNAEGKKIYTTDVVCEDIEFVESKKNGEGRSTAAGADGFMDVPESLNNNLPFS